MRVDEFYGCSLQASFSSYIRQAHVDCALPVYLLSSEKEQMQPAKIPDENVLILNYYSNNNTVLT